MKKYNIPPTNLNWLTTYIAVQNGQKALDFYTQVFGFKELLSQKDNSGNIVFARITYNGCNIVFSPHKPFEGEYDRSEASVVSKTIPSFSFYLYCDDVENRYKKYSEYGLKILMPLTDRFWGDCTFRVVDQEGYVWDFATPVAEFDPTKLPVNLR